MIINLHDVIAKPESSLPFSQELDTDRLSFPGVLAYVSPVVGEGVIRNDGATLSLRGSIHADMLCRCDRCATEFRRSKDVELDVALATELEDEENPDFFLLRGEKLDLDELLESCFILEMDTLLLCRPDCRGLCERCGANLNYGKCSCTKERDPRLAVLEQLLDDKE